jgi:hypothetical protein
MFGKLGYEPISHPVGLEALRTFDAEGFRDAGRDSADHFGIDPDQFTLFQLTAGNDGPPIVDLHAASPTLNGTADNPDVRVSIDLLSFRIAPAEGLDPKMQATLRLDMGKDRSSASPLDPLFWSIAAGLDLAAQAVSAPKQSKVMSADFSKAFKQRPIEIAGGLAQLRVEVVAHAEPPWWRRVFAFADNASVRKLVAAVGFPGIALDAVQLLDATMSQFAQSKAKPIFQSRPLTVALSDRAAVDYSAGLSTVSTAVLNDGIFILLRHRDASLLVAEPPVYLGGYGRLVPKKGWDPTNPKLADGQAYSDLSYAVLRVKTRAVRLDTGL